MKLIGLQQLKLTRDVSFWQVREVDLPLNLVLERKLCSLQRTGQGSPSQVLRHKLRSGGYLSLEDFTLKHKGATIRARGFLEAKTISGLAAAILKCVERTSSADFNEELLRPMQKVNMQTRRAWVESKLQLMAASRIEQEEAPAANRIPYFIVGLDRGLAERLDLTPVREASETYLFYNAGSSMFRQNSAFCLTSYGHTEHKGKTLRIEEGVAVGDGLLVTYEKGKLCFERHHPHVPLWEHSDKKRLLEKLDKCGWTEVRPFWKTYLPTMLPYAYVFSPAGSEGAERPSTGKSAEEMGAYEELLRKPCYVFDLSCWVPLSEPVRVVESADFHRRLLGSTAGHLYLPARKGLEKGEPARGALFLCQVPAGAKVA